MKQLNLTSNPYIIKCKDYNTLTFDLIYPTTYEQKNIFDKELFKQIVMNSYFDYYENDTIEDIEKENYEEYSNMINLLDFSNYTILKMLKKKN